MPEQGDAGDVPATAQDLGGAPVTSITGTFASGADADLYRVCLSTGASFSASTVGGTTPANMDTQLFLFDSNGFGVYANDDAVGTRTSRLPANHRFSPATGGVYFLGVSPFNHDPQSSQGEIFPDTYSRTQYPDDVLNATGFGGSRPLDHWNGRWPFGPSAYRINITGTKGCDSTPPVVDLRTPQDGARVRQGAELTVDFSCSDEGGSGLASCVGSVADGERLDTSTLGDVSVTVTARDGAGNQTVVTHTVTVVDETAPGITLDSPADGAVYEHGELVTAAYSCADEPNGSGLESCSGDVADGAPVDTSVTGQHTFTVDAADRAGNTASRTVTYTVVDVTPPAINLTAPADGAVYTIGQQVLAAYGCEDQAGGSGLASCAGTVPSGAAIDTSSTGAHSFEVNAADGAGNTATKTVTYSVVYPFDGFLWPVLNPPAVNRWKAGTPVPIRFSLGGYLGARPEADGYPQVTRCGGGSVQPVTGHSKKRPVFHYDRRSDRYWLMWKTERRWAGSCREFVLRLDDGSVHTAQFEFSKHRDRDEDDD